METESVPVSTDRFFDKVLNGGGPTHRRESLPTTRTQGTASNDETAAAATTTTTALKRMVTSIFQSEQLLQETNLLTDIVNKISFCRISSFQSSCIKVNCIMSTSMQATLTFHISKETMRLERVQGNNAESAEAAERVEVQTVLRLHDTEVDLVMTAGRLQDSRRSSCRDWRGRTPLSTPSSGRCCVLMTFVGPYPPQHCYRRSIHLRSLHSYTG